MKYLFLILLGCVFINSSCQNELDNVQLPNTETTSISVDSCLAGFSMLLSRAVYNTPMLRTFLKNESLKMIDNDYDVFYPIIKNEIVSNGKSFRNVLEEYDNDNILETIEKNLPLLTIYIPDLPSDFNAENWNTLEEVPYITFRGSNNGQQLYYNNGEVGLKLKSEYIPGFPVLVVKNNERIIVKDPLTRNSDESSLNWEYCFIDKAFDGINQNVNVANTRVANPSYEYLRTAYTEMGVTSSYWQRDNIYYGLTPTMTSGPLKNNIAECIWALCFSESALERMCDGTGDPTLKPKPGMHDKDAPSHGANQSWFWLDGKFEFKIDIIINNQAGLGTSLTKYITASPTDLYGLGYMCKREGDFHYFVITEAMPLNFHTDINLVTWDLEKNSCSWKFIFTEIDDQETYTLSETTYSEYATNFGFTLGISKKIGLNFGSSAKESKQTQYTRVVYKNSDELGTLEANFSDPVALRSPTDNSGSSRWVLNFYKVSNPMVEMYLIPKVLY